MPRSTFDADLSQTIRDAQQAAREQRTRTVSVDGALKTIRSPFPSPVDWRSQWIYFLLIDRFHHPQQAPQGVWNRPFGKRQGGTFRGVQSQLGYLESLGVGALWLSPVLKNPSPDWDFNYHGYAAQDFLNLDERFASDGTRATAEREFTSLVEEAHARGMYVILDIVLNHAARVFDYVRGGSPVAAFADPQVINGPLGSEPPVQWLNGFGFPRGDWQNQLPYPSALSADDAVWPSDLQNFTFFRRRGSKISDAPGDGGFVPGDFDTMRQLVVEYDASVPGQERVRDRYGVRPVLSILIQAYQYLVARYDLDGFRIDTVKYVDPEMIETFGNAIREFALSTGKHNFFTFGEVYDNEETIAKFIGRNGGDGEGYGVDAALDFPLFFELPAVAKGMKPVESIRRVFEQRKAEEKNLLSSHGEAGRYFVSFLDNHDQKQRIQHPQTPPEQVSLAFTVLFALQGIPCVYYGTEQGLSGTVDASGNAALDSMESVREALWGKPGAFDQTSAAFRTIQDLAKWRAREPPLAFGRLYFREVSGDGEHFGFSSGIGGIVAFSRILVDREVVVIANTNPSQAFDGFVTVDRDLNRKPRTMEVAFSNRGGSGQGTVEIGERAKLRVILRPSEAQILVPAS